MPQMIIDRVGGAGSVQADDEHASAPLSLMVNVPVGGVDPAGIVSVTWYAFEKPPSGDPVSVNEKYMPKYSKRLNVKLVIVSNDMPKFHDKTNALWSRLVIIPFMIVQKGDKSIDGIIDEPVGGAHRQKDETIANVGDKIEKALDSLTPWNGVKLVRKRHQKFLEMGRP